ncbi:Rrf2 family transcriptional regulator (plasmid) [Pseudorhodobacter turbinis]|uniref:Rrf2 family transcriptional regulator n=1 Tax=Pseudorhodobacter turbinis TaxID=2500533 RepID=A0A4P8EKU0_9RHOB|nr:Rrf2 family transcriptional regulator [Pseudorhodobacter turbinis]QCO57666.1 Rrf2 family transcriptional regulator [Pseudorhodobacter turbinis]
MQLDKFTDYALRVLVTLSIRTPDRVPAAEIARLYGLSANHLAKVATELVRTGFVNSERGRGGGLRLARPAGDINIGAVLRALKQHEPVAECFSNVGTCLIAPACGLRSPLAEAQEAFFASLDRYTLADVTTSKTKLLVLLAP